MALKYSSLSISGCVSARHPNSPNSSCQPIVIKISIQRFPLRNEKRIDNVTIRLTCDRMGFNVGGKRMDGVRVADVNTKFAFYRRGRSESDDGSSSP